MKHSPKNPLSWNRKKSNLHEHRDCKTALNPQVKLSLVTGMQLSISKRKQKHSSLNKRHPNSEKIKTSEPFRSAGNTHATRLRLLQTRPDVRIPCGGRQAVHRMLPQCLGSLLLCVPQQDPHTMAERWVHTDKHSDTQLYLKLQERRLLRTEGVVSCRRRD